MPGDFQMVLSCAACCPSGGSGSGSPVTTPCCPLNPIPLTLYLTPIASTGGCAGCFTFSSLPMHFLEAGLAGGWHTGAVIAACNVLGSGATDNFVLACDPSVPVWVPSFTCAGPANFTELLSFDCTLPQWLVRWHAVPFSGLLLCCNGLAGTADFIITA